MIKLLMCALLLPISVFAAILKAPDELVVLAVNDQQIEQSWFGSANEATLSLGNNWVKLKYLDLFEVGYDQHEIVESEPFWLAIEVVDTDKTLQLTFTKPDSVAAAKAFVSSSAKQFTLEGVNQPLAVFDMKPSHAMNNVEHAVSTAASKAVSQPLPLAAKLNTQQSNGPNALNMLEFWWQQASIEQQKLFLKQISQQ